MDIGRDNGLVVDHKDNAQYAFTGTVTKVVFDVEPATHEDEQIQGIAQGATG